MAAAAPANARLERHPGADVLLVSFSSHHLRRDRPFEMQRFLAQIGTHRLFVRDPARMWYLTGIPGIGPQPADLAGFVCRTAEQLAVRRLVTIGISAGGFAALLLGLMCGAHECVAYVPQTRLTSLSDSRTPWRIAQLWRRYPIDDPMLDIVRAHAAARPPDFRINVVFGSDPLDVAHAGHVAGLAGVRLEQIPHPGHLANQRLLRAPRARAVLEDALR